MSAIKRAQIFSAVHTVGGLLPADMLVRIAEGKDVDGARPADYRVIGSRSVQDEAERHWEYLRSVWAELRNRLPRVPEAEVPVDATGTAVSQWLLPLFSELGFGALTALGAAGITSDDGAKTFPVSHRWTHVPVHLMAWQSTLDARVGGAVPAQSLLQECLNRTEAHLWGIVSNGRQLRLLRDSNALATAAYVEFDLEAIFDGELFSEFVLLYRLLHVSRFAVAEDAAPSACWLEKWRSEAITSGARALEQLSKNVQQAITALGTGFLRHPDNTALREDVDVTALHAALLRLVYRLLFVFVAEDRDVLHDPAADRQACDRYATYFSTARLRAHSLRRRGTAHHDLYAGLRIVLDALGDEHGRPELGLPGLGGIFDPAPADAPLDGLKLANEHLLEAVRHLARVRDTASKRWRAVDYRHLDAEELGSVYESLLELVPRHSAVDLSFELVEAAGNARKTTGSYYTPSSLIELVLDSALDPVIDDAVKRGEQAATGPDPSESIVGELLSLTVCDPACGSGHFLVAAARRIAKRVAAVREGNPEPTLPAVRTALHEVIARCIYGVDLNPMAVELAKVSLWLEALEPGKPLSFLDAHLKCGNALIGVTPALLKQGIPEEAFKPIVGDDPAFARSLAKQSANAQMSLLDATAEIQVANVGVAYGLQTIFTAPADTLADVHKQAERYADLEASPEYRAAELAADAWCAAFLWRKTPDAPKPVTQDVFLALQNPEETDRLTETRAEIARLRAQYRFLHWHLAFPEVFAVSTRVTGIDNVTGWAGGFTCVVGNPPWDKVDFEDKKYFSVVDPTIAALPGLRRRTRIAAWVKEDREAGQKYLTARRKVKGAFHFAADSGVYPLCASGLTVKGVTMLQTDHLFAESMSRIINANGRVSCIIPTTIATGAAAQRLFGHFASEGMLAALYDFENRNKLFDMHASYKFCVLSLGGSRASEDIAKFAFFLLSTQDLKTDDRVVKLSSEEILLLSPNTATLPIFRSNRDARLTTSIYQRIPVLVNEAQESPTSWPIDFLATPFHMTDDSDIFRTREDLELAGWRLEDGTFVLGEKRMLPLYEGKMAHHFDHRYSHYYGTGNEDRRHLKPWEKQDPSQVAGPRYWVIEEGVVATARGGSQVKVPGVALRLDAQNWNHEWLYGWRDICRTTDERTAIPALLPRVAVGHTFPLMLPRVSPQLISTLVAVQSSMVFDYVSRQKIGGAHMALMTWKQLPVPAPRDLEPHTSFVIPRVLELVYTSYDMSGFARELGDPGGPFRWDEDRRARIRAELDAYCGHLYGVSRDDFDYLLDSFQSNSGGLKNSDVAKFGSYRTKELVLEEYDRMATLGCGLGRPLIDGQSFTSTLTPPPGNGPRHPQRDRLVE